MSLGHFLGIVQSERLDSIQVHVGTDLSISASYVVEGAQLTYIIFLERLVFLVVGGSAVVLSKLSDVSGCAYLRRVLFKQGRNELKFFLTKFTALYATFSFCDCLNMADDIGSFLVSFH